MIEWNAPKRGGKNGLLCYMTIATNKGGGRVGQHLSQLVIKFSATAVKDLRLIAGDRVLIGPDSVTKQVCFKRTTDGTGYKVTGMLGKTLTVKASMKVPAISVQAIQATDVKTESTHVAIYCPAIFESTAANVQVSQ